MFCVFFFKKNKDGKAVTVIPETMHTLKLRIHRFLQLVKCLRRYYTLHIYLTLICDL